MPDLPGFDFGPPPGDGPPPELLEALRRAVGGHSHRREPDRVPAQRMTKHAMPTASVIIAQLETVSQQPGYAELYKTVADQLADRSVNGADLAGTLLTAVVHFVEDEEPIVKAIAHTLVQDWLIVLAEGDSEFEDDAGRFFAHILMGAVAVQHLSGAHLNE